VQAFHEKGFINYDNTMMLAESYKQAHKKHQPGIDGVGDEHGQAQQRLQRSIQVAGVALIHEACTQMRDVHTINT
jgi:hypothetical protein